MIFALDLLLTAGLLGLLAVMTGGIHLDDPAWALAAALVANLIYLPLIFFRGQLTAFEGIWITLGVWTAMNLVGLLAAHLLLSGFTLRSAAVTLLAAFLMACLDFAVPLAVVRLMSLVLA